MFTSTRTAAALVAFAACLIGSPLLAQDPVPSKVWTVSFRRLDPAEQTLVATLQGLVARGDTESAEADSVGGREVIWRRERGMNAVVLDGLERAGAVVERARSPWELVERFNDHVRGYIVYDLREDSINVATSLCGPMNAVAVDASLVERAKDAGLEQLADVRGQNELEALRQHAGKFSSDVVLVQEERKNSHLRDWGVSENAFCFAGVGGRRRVETIRSLGERPMVYGWEGELDFVRGVSRAGGMVLPADWSANLSVLARLPVEVPRPPRRYPEPVKPGQRVVAFVMSDGDNIQWMGGGFVSSRGFWASPHRGRFNMSWEVAPMLSEVAPRVMRHFYQTAAGGDAADNFVTGPSGAAYVFPSYYPDFAAFAQLTGQLMDQAHLSVATIINSDGDMDQSRPLLEQPQVLGVLYKGWDYDAERGRVWWHEGKPSVSYRYSVREGRGEKSLREIADAIAAQPADPQHDENSYALIDVHAWSYGDIGGPMEAVKRCVDMLPEGTRVVTAEQLVILLRNNLGEPVDRAEYERMVAGGAE